ncbi:SDR family oxidoreductase [Sphingosinicella sp. CPCC 101087]|uniref:SDR family oxidoreductase n=1 Tax=Sphingosinicella sp. CPCC 101087 TaxID=2497754 RepID=UPI00101D8BF3|nr:SDR family oxidoreductase [Sphingosinicella sp. CPCC 101087]
MTRALTIAVLGGTGLVGRMLAERLDQLGHEVVVAARSTGVDLVSGEGLQRALMGADVVVDVSNPGYTNADEMRRFFEGSSANLLRREREAGIAHHVALSAVGAARFHSGYFLAKKAQEKMVRASALPFTILRSTPFFEFIYAIVDANGNGDDIRLPPAAVQPVAASDIADMLARIALSEPANGVVEIGGPDIATLPTLAALVLTANEDPRRVVTDVNAPFFGARIGGGSLICCARPPSAPTHFEDWLRQSLAV